MAKRISGDRAWIFISHATDDLLQVRKVRNYLETKGASPLLFHLLALKEPEEFWPVIEKEIQARNFFLYCDSEAAASRKWVARERAAVEAAARIKPIRIGAIRVDGPELDVAALDAFLAKTRVFLSFSSKDIERVMPYARALEEAGFQVFEGEGTTSFQGPWSEMITRELELSAREGWVVPFLSNSSLKSELVQAELSHAERLGAKLVPVMIESIPIPSNLADTQVFDGTGGGAPQRLAAELLQRRV